MPPVPASPAGAPGMLARIRFDRRDGGVWARLWPAGRAFVRTVGTRVEPGNRAAGFVPAPRSMRHRARPCACPREPVDVGRQNLPRWPLGRPEHIGQNPQGAGLHSTPDLFARRRGQSRAPQFRITSLPIEQGVSGVSDDRPIASLVKTHVAARAPPWPARSCSSAPTAAKDPDRRAIGLIGHQLKLAGAELVTLPALQVPSRIWSAGNRLGPSERITAVHALRQQPCWPS
jgi:hypothetical protein